jgi:hypothetical protein
MKISQTYILTGIIVFLSCKSETESLITKLDNSAGKIVKPKITSMLAEKTIDAETLDFFATKLKSYWSTDTNIAINLAQKINSIEFENINSQKSVIRIQAENQLKIYTITDVTPRFYLLDSILPKTKVENKLEVLKKSYEGLNINQELITEAQTSLSKNNIIDTNTISYIKSDIINLSFSKVGQELQNRANNMGLAKVGLYY